MNQVTLLGHLTKDPELNNTGSVCKTSIAVNNRRDSTTMYIELVFFGKLSEIVQQYLYRGSKICVHGRLDLNTWTHEGKNKQKHVVIVSELEMLGPKKSDDTDSQQSNGSESNKTIENTFFPEPNIDIDEEEIPF